MILSSSSLCHCPAAARRPAQSQLARAAPVPRAPTPRHSMPIAETASNSRDVRARAASSEEGEAVSAPWYTRPCGPNSVEVNSVQELVDVLATDQLVIVDFFAPWCGACRALFPKIHKLLQEHPDVLLVKVNFEANRAMCKSLGIKVLPYFMFYRGALGRVAGFSATVSKLKVFQDALEAHSGAICSLEPPPGLTEFADVHPADATLLDRDGWAKSGAGVAAGAPSS